MHVTIAQTQLKKVLINAKRCVGDRARLPEYGCFRLGAGGGALVVQATNGETSVNIVTDAQTIDVGTVMVPAGDFKSVIDSLSGTVEISTPKEGYVTITDGLGTFELRILPNPDNVMFDDQLFALVGTPVDISAQVPQLAKIAACASRDTARPVLTGVHFRPGHVEATDSYKLAVLDLDHEFEGLVPHGLFAIIEQAKPTSASLDVSKGSTVVRAVTKFGTVTWAARNLDGTFPHVEQLIPSTYERAFTLQRKPTGAALKRLSAVRSRSATIPVTADFDGVNLALQIGSGEIGEGGLTVPAPGTAGLEPFRIAFNPTHWRGVLDAATEDVIEIQMRDNLRPAVMRTAGYIGLVMPVRL